MHTALFRFFWVKFDLLDYRTKGHWNKGKPVVVLRESGIKTWRQLLPCKCKTGLQPLKAFLVQSVFYMRSIRHFVLKSLCLQLHSQLCLLSTLMVFRMYISEAVSRIFNIHKKVTLVFKYLFYPGSLQLQVKSTQKKLSSADFGANFLWNNSSTLNRLAE